MCDCFERTEPCISMIAVETTMLRQKNNKEIKKSPQRVNVESESVQRPQGTKSTSSITSNKSVNPVASNRENISKRSNAVTKVKYAECKETDLETLPNTKNRFSSSSGQKITSRIVTENKVPLESRTEGSLTSKGRAGQSISTSSPLRIKSEKLINTTDIEKTCSLKQDSDRQGISTDKTVNTLVHPKKGESFNTIGENIKDEGCKQNHHAKTSVRNMKTQKSNNPQVQTMKNSTCNISLTTEMAKSAKDISTKIICKSESISLTRDQISTTTNAQIQKLQVSPARLSVQSRMEASHTAGKHIEHIQQAATMMDQILDLSFPSGGVSYIMPSTRQKTEIGQAKVAAKAISNKVAKVCGQDFISANIRPNSHSTRANLGNISVQVKPSKTPPSLKTDLQDVEAQTLQSVHLSQSRVKVSKSPSADQNRAATLRKLSSEKKSELYNKQNASGREQSYNISGGISKDIKPDELVSSVEKSKRDSSLQNTKIDSSVVSHHPRSNNRRLFSSQPQNESKKNEETNSGSKDRSKDYPIKTQTLSKTTNEDCKGDSNGTEEEFRKYKHSNNVENNKSQIVETFAQSQRETNLLPSDGTEKMALNGTQNSKCRKPAIVSRRYVPKNQLPTSTTDASKLTTGHKIPQSKHLAESSPRNTTLHGSCNDSHKLGVCDITQFIEKVKENDLLPVICFFWRKRNETLLEHEQKSNQCVLSLDQGLDMLKRIMAEITPEDIFCGNEFMLSQVKSYDPKTLAIGPGSDSDNEFGLASGTYFQLTPRPNLKSKKMSRASFNRTTSSDIRDMLKIVNKRFHNERTTANMSEPSSTLHDQMTICEEGFQTGDTSEGSALEAESSDSESQDNSESINLSTVWYSMTRRIIAFFFNSRVKQRFLQIHANCLENSRIEHDEPGCSNEDGHNSEEDVSSSHRVTDLVLPSHHVKPAIIALLGYLLPGLADLSSSCSNSQEQLSEIEGTCRESYNPWQAHQTSNNNVTERTISDKNENKSRFKDVFNVLLWKNPLENRTAFSGISSITSKKINEASEKQLQNLDAVNNVVKVETVENVRNCLEYSKCRPTIVSEVCDFNTPNVTINQEPHIDNEDNYTFVDSSALYMNSLYSEEMTGNELTNNSNNIESADIDQNTIMPVTNSGNVFVYEYLQSDEHETSKDYASTTSSELCPDPCLDVSNENMASLSITNLPGFGTTGFKQHPHLVWICRCSYIKEHKDSDWMREKFESRTNTLNIQMNSTHEDSLTQLHDLEETDSLKPILCKDALSHDYDFVHGHVLNDINCPVGSGVRSENISYTKKVEIVCSDTEDKVQNVFNDYNSSYIDMTTTLVLKHSETTVYNSDQSSSYDTQNEAYISTGIPSDPLFEGHCAESMRPSHDISQNDCQERFRASYFSNTNVQQDVSKIYHPDAELSVNGSSEGKVYCSHKITESSGCLFQRADIDSQEQIHSEMADRELVIHTMPFTGRGADGVNTVKILEYANDSDGQLQVTQLLCKDNPTPTDLVLKPAHTATVQFGSNTLKEVSEAVLKDANNRHPVAINQTSQPSEILSCIHNECLDERIINDGSASSKYTLANTGQAQGFESDIVYDNPYNDIQGNCSFPGKTVSQREYESVAIPVNITLSSNPTQAGFNSLEELKADSICPPDPATHLQVNRVINEVQSHQYQTKNESILNV